MKTRPMKEDHDGLTALKLDQVLGVHVVKCGRALSSGCAKILKTFPIINKIND